MANLGIAVPPALQAVRTVTGWPRIIVDALDERLDIDSLKCPDDAGAEAAVGAIWEANDLAVESQLAHQDALVYGRSYLAVGVVVGAGRQKKNKSKKPSPLSVPPGPGERVCLGARSRALSVLNLHVAIRFDTSRIDGPAGEPRKGSLSFLLLCS
ncbi:hypothetical protein M1P56_35175 (plasmid) [Streptomyces sp. HU2014]|uniref:hypothetical protein n=1 Tax=Streptomyces sp. HU2014 TaxID=2939414 RepID=UPI002010B954|nr:hypothetical protein [Streptomyces sp. HU2014]UQI49756.1 hypothetical protein M1P56_35175 [Streptomyces sp. HU2014]